MGKHYRHLDPHEVKLHCQQVQMLLNWSLSW